MAAWRRKCLSVLAVLAAVLLVAAGALGMDEAANIKTGSLDDAAAPAVHSSVHTSGGEASFEHRLVLGLAKGALPGGFPFDEPREEKWDENYQEILYQHPAPAGAR